MKSIMTFFQNLTVGKKLLLLLTPIITLFLNMKLAIIGLFFLILIDLLTGIRKNHYKYNIKFNPFKKEFWKGVSVTINSKEEKHGGLKSYLLRKTWKKTYEYIFGIIAIAVIEVFILGTTEVEIIGKTNNLTRWGVIIASTIELWSIFENMEAVSGRNFLKKLVGILPQNIKKLFESLDKKMYNE